MNAPVADAVVNAALLLSSRDVALVTSALAEPVGASLALCVVFALGSWLAALATGYWSYVDRLWSITPVVFAGVFVWFAPAHPRLALMWALAFVWGARLTINFARKGGYAAEEDYRWAVLREWFRAHDPLHPMARETFSLVFVAAYQHALLWALAVLPCTAVLLARGETSKLTAVDFTLAAMFLCFLGIETLCDEQQWAFQALKHSLSPAERAAAGGDLARGFRTSGAFACSRHANFFAEQCLWWTWAAFSLVGVPVEAAGGAGALTPLALPFLGPALLSLLFLGSTAMTEALSVDKYPAYAAFQQTTSRLLPWLPGPPLDSEEGARILARVLGPALVADAARGSRKGK